MNQNKRLKRQIEVLETVIRERQEKMESYPDEFDRVLYDEINALEEVVESLEQVETFVSTFYLH